MIVDVKNLRSKSKTSGKTLEILVQKDLEGTIRHDKFLLILNLNDFLFSAIMLWCYQSLDDRIRIRKESQKIERWVEAGTSPELNLNLHCLIS